MMYWWNISELKSVLVERDLSARESLPYLLALFIGYDLILLFGFLADGGAGAVETPPTVWAALDRLLQPLITLAGCICVYRISRERTSSRWLARVLALSWVVGVRLLPLVLVTEIVMFGLDRHAYPEVSAGSYLRSESVLSMVLSVAWSVIYYWRLAANLRDVEAPGDALLVTTHGSKPQPC